jgi:uncharacterized cupredoxin-like copper-binding protein
MTPLISPRRQVPRIAVAVGLAVVLAACGGSEDRQNASVEGGNSAADTIRVTMTDYAYEPSDITVPAGQEVTLQFTNDGTVEHYFVVGDTPTADGEGVQQNLFESVDLTKNKEGGGEEEEGEEHEEGEGHHENEFELPPGGSGALTFTLPASKAGTYTIACFETTGGQTHFERGMEGTLTVTARDDE